METEVVGERLKILLNNKKVSYSELAKVIGISQKRLLKKLNGEKSFTIQEATTIKDYLNLDLELAHNIFFNPEFKIEKL